MSAFRNYYTSDKPFLHGGREVGPAEFAGTLTYRSIDEATDAAVDFCYWAKVQRGAEVTMTHCVDENDTPQVAPEPRTFPGEAP